MGSIAASVQAHARRAGNGTVRHMATVFSRIIAGEIPATFVHRDEECVGFMSINPLAPGHVLVVPVVEIDHWIDAPPALVAHLFTVAHRIGRAQQLAFDPQRVGLIVAGYEVPHMHIHVIPTNDMSEMNFANAATTVDPEELESAAAAIRTALSG
jgi:diadenosine tetraphosphate (Ap4A) HIT family hydrolase